MFGKKKREGVTGHIKENTFGSSNEISFSVLDAKVKSVEEDPDSQKEKGRSPLGRISLFTLGKNKKPSSTPTKDQLITPPTYTEGTNSNRSSAGTTGRIDMAKVNAQPEGAPKPKWEYPQHEIDARKAKRRKAKRSMVLVGVLIGLVCLSIAGYFGVRAIQHQMDFIGQLDEQVALVDDQRTAIDPLVQLIDGISTKPLDELDAANIRSAASNYESTYGRIEDALSGSKGQIERIQEHLVNPSDKERSNQTIMRINAMLNLLTIGHDIIDWCVPYLDQYDLSQQFMSKLIEGDTLAREAVEAASVSTKAGFQDSMAKSTEAIEKFNEAISAASSLRDEYQLGQMQSYIDYVDLRINAQQSAITADQAYINVNSAQLIAANDDYNAKEQQAAEIIVNMGGEYPADVVGREFEAARSSDSDFASWTSELAKA